MMKYFEKKKKFHFNLFHKKLFKKKKGKKININKLTQFAILVDDGNVGFVSNCVRFKYS